MDTLAVVGPTASRQLVFIDDLGPTGPFKSIVTASLSGSLTRHFMDAARMIS